MQDYMNGNRALWNEMTPIHARSAFYNIDGFKRGRITLDKIEREEVGDVTGKSLLHLQCHFGMDTMSWARLGANVTGIDFSDEAITLARSLSQELNINARFIQSNIYDLPNVLDEQFDLVFTSHGVLCWLPDLARWGQIVTRYLKPGGTFYIFEGHPLLMTMSDAPGISIYQIGYRYFQGTEPLRFEGGGSDYADQNARLTHPSFEWIHNLGSIITALTSAGLHLEFLREFPFCAWQALPFLEQGADGWWRAPEGMIPIPMTFSLKAIKPER